MARWPSSSRLRGVNTNSTRDKLVPPGALQIETGLEYERARVGGGPTQQQLTAQAVLRAGLATVLEVSLEGEPFVWQRADHDTAGSGDYTLGLKHPPCAPPAGSGRPRRRAKPFVKPTTRPP